MVFHEHIFPATLLLIMIQVLAISKIMKISLQNCTSILRLLTFRSVYIYIWILVSFFPLSQPSFWGTCLYWILAIPWIWLGEDGYPDPRECIPAHLEFISKDKEKWKSLVYKRCTISLHWRKIKCIYQKFYCWSKQQSVSIIRIANRQTDNFNQLVRRLAIAKLLFAFYKKTTSKEIHLEKALISS